MNLRATIAIATACGSLVLLACASFREDAAPPSESPGPTDAATDSGGEGDVAVSPPPPPGAPSRAKVAPSGHAYDIVVAEAQTISWSAARDAARSAGGHLVTIDGPGEQAFVAAMLAARASELYVTREDYRLGPWLGAVQRTGAREPDGGWEWVTGEPFHYTNWHEGEPNDGLIPTNPHESASVFSFLVSEGFRATWADLSDNDAIRSYVVEWEP